MKGMTDSEIRQQCYQHAEPVVRRKWNWEEAECCVADSDTELCIWASKNL